MIRILATALTLSLLALPAAAKDADVVAPADVVASAVNVAGPVQVNQGEQFLPLRTGEQLRAGDRVMALRNGSAVIKFKDGCDLKVDPETMVTVPDVSTCAGGVVAAQAIAPADSDAVGTVATASGGIDTTGAAIITGIVVVGDAILFNENNNETVSP